MTDYQTTVYQALCDETAKTIAFFDAIPPEQWPLPVYQTPYVWTIRDLLLHFIDTEPILYRIVVNILNGGEGSPEGADVDEHNAEAMPRMRIALADQSNAELIKAFEESRGKLLRRVQAMSDADFERRGRHPALGIMPLSDMIRVIYMHYKLHQRDIRRALEAEQERHKMSDRKHEIIQRLDQSRAYLHSVVDHLTPEQWETTIQESDARWTTRQLVGHLYSAEKGMLGQIGQIASGQETVSADFDVNRWNKRSVEKMADKPAAEIVQALNEVRTTLKQTVHDLAETDLDKRGRHGNLRIMSIEEILHLIASHESGHTAEIAQVLKITVPQP